MKKTRLIALILLFTMFLLYSCQSGNNTSITSVNNTGSTSADSNTESKIVSDATCRELLALAIAEEGEENLNIYYSDDAEKQLDEFAISDYYGTLLDTPDFNIIDSYAVFTSKDPIVQECHILKVKSTENIETAKTYLQRRFDRIKEKFIGYEPNQVEAAEDGKLFTYGNFVIYVTTMDNNDKIINNIKNKIDGK